MNKLRNFFAAVALAGLFLLTSLAEAGVRVHEIQDSYRD